MHETELPRFLSLSLSRSLSLVSLSMQDSVISSYLPGDSPQNPKFHPPEKHPKYKKH